MKPHDCPRPSCPVALSRAERLADCAASYNAAIEALARMKPQQMKARDWIEARGEWRT